MNTLLHRPQRLLLRRALFQIHLWTGIGVGIYVLVISLTGSILVFREEIEASLYPRLFKVIDSGPPKVEMAAILDTVQAAYPNHQLLGVYSPEGYRQTFVAWLSKGEEVSPVFVHPMTGSILGERPEEYSWLSWLQDLHFYLLAGKTGLLVNGIGGLFVLLLCMTGLVIWWPGVENWVRSLKVDFRNTWKRINWDLHSAVGFWTVPLLAMWAATGAYFAFPQQFKSLVNRFSAVSTLRAPVSDPAAKERTPARDFRWMIAKAHQEVPGAVLARVSLPRNEMGAFQVVMAPNGIRESNEVGYVSFYFDRHSGEVLQKRVHANQTIGDFVMAWVGSVHVGSFGGLVIKILWAVLGLAPALLFVTGALMWWNRVLAEKLGRRRSSAQERLKPAHTR